MPKDKSRKPVPPALAHELVSRGYSLDEELAAQRAILFARIEPATASKYYAAYRDYAAYCARLREAPSPIRVVLLNAWVRFKCSQMGNAVSASKWRTQVISAVFYYRQHETEFTAHERAQMRAYDIGLAKVYGSRSEKGSGMTGDVLRLIYQRVRPDPRRDLAQWVTWAHLVLSYVFILRPNEHTQGCDGVVGHVRFKQAIGLTPSGAELTLLHTKGMLKKGTDVPEHAYARDGGDYPGDPVDGPLVLRQYFALFGLRDDPHHPLFCRVVAGVLVRKEITAAEWNSDLKALQVAAGLASLHTARDTRAGRRTDLKNAGNDVEHINMLGRWSAGSYTGARHYQGGCDTALQWSSTALPAARK